VPPISTRLMTATIANWKQEQFIHYCDTQRRSLLELFLRRGFTTVPGGFLNAKSQRREDANVFFLLGALASLRLCVETSFLSVEAAKSEGNSFGCGFPRCVPLWQKSSQKTKRKPDPILWFCDFCAFSRQFNSLDRPAQLTRGGATRTSSPGSSGSDRNAAPIPPANQNAAKTAPRFRPASCQTADPPCRESDNARPGSRRRA
jgi:hypothetical protein